MSEFEELKRATEEEIDRFFAILQANAGRIPPEVERALGETLNAYVKAVTRLLEWTRNPK